MWLLIEEAFSQTLILYVFSLILIKFEWQQLNEFPPDFKTVNKTQST